jgi:hypothetical protein
MQVEIGNGLLIVGGVMALTDKCDLYGSITEEAINGVLSVLQLQRPSLFNYGTQAFADRARDKRRAPLLCTPIKVDDRVRNSDNPYITIEKPLPVIGSKVNVGLNWLLQISDVAIDLSPSGLVALPPELGVLPPQSLAIRAKACFTLDCPDAKFIDEIVAAIEQTLEDVRDERDRRENADAARANTFTKNNANQNERGKEADPKNMDPRVPPLPDKIACACFNVFAVAHSEWGPGGTAIPQEEWFKVHLDGLEIVDISPKQLESQIECYLSSVLRFAILPAVSLPISRLVLNLTEEIKKWGLPIAKRVTLSPTAVPTSVPNNPAIENNEIRAFITLAVEDI